MNWFFFGCINVLAIAISSLYQKLAMNDKESDPVISAAIFEFILGFLSIIALFITGFHIPNFNLWPYILISGTLYGLRGISNFKAIKRIEASELTVISGTGIFVTLIISYIFLAERLTSLQIIGALLIVLGTLVVTYKHTGFKLNMGILLALLGSTCYGIAVVFDGYILRTYDVFSFIPIIAFMTGISILVMNPNKIHSFGRSILKINKNLIIYSFFYVIGATSFYYPISQGILVSQISAFGRVAIILTVILAAIFLNERSHIGKKILGAILTTIGIFLIR